jgi:hypothetical protein
MGILGLVRRRSVARALVNLIPSGYGAMTVDTDGNGIVDGFAAAQALAFPVYTLDGGQKITLADVTNAGGYGNAYLSGKFAVSPNTVHTLSIDAALVKSGAERILLRIVWYTSADVLISQSDSAQIDPGATYSRQQLTATSPAMAGKAVFHCLLLAKAVGATGVAHFKDALFQAA